MYVWDLFLETTKEVSKIILVDKNEISDIRYRLAH